MAENRFDYCVGTASTGLKKTLVTMLNEAGFYPVGEGKNVSSFLRTLRKTQPWLAVIDTALPPGNIEELASIIENDGLAAAIYINTSGTSLDQRVQLSWPVEAAVLTAVAEAVCYEYAQKKKLQKKVDELQKSLKERKTVEKAKGLIASIYKQSEDEAYLILRKYSMNQRITMAEAAARVIADPGSLSFPGPHR